MSRTPEEIKKEHDENYDAEILRCDTDWETWKLDFGGDAIFSVSFWNRDENSWSTYMAQYKIWQVIELPDKQLLIGWRPVEEWVGMYNSLEYHLLSESRFIYYPPGKDE